MKETIRVLISAEEIEKRINELARQIMEDYKGKTLTMICVLKGGVMFLVDLAKSLQMDVEFDFLEISSYGDAMESSGIVRIQKDLKNPIVGKDVLLIEDIIDSGRTLSHLVQHLNSQRPNSLRVCTLLDKPDRRVVADFTPDYSGFVIPDEFVVGYGLDYSQRYRNLSYIGVLSLSEE